MNRAARVETLMYLQRNTQNINGLDYSGNSEISSALSAKKIPLLFLQKRNLCLEWSRSVV